MSIIVDLRAQRSESFICVGVIVVVSQVLKPVYIAIIEQACT